MLKKTITYEDFNGETVSEDFFFHLSKAELVEIEMSHEGGLSNSLKKIIDAEDGKTIIAEFKNIILGAYGKRSDDGKRFIKNQTLREEFESSEAYSTLFMELVTDMDAAITFVNGIIPAGMAEEAEQLAKKEAVIARDDNRIKLPPEIAIVPQEQEKAKTVILSRLDIVNMPPEEFAKLPERIASGEVQLSD